MKFFTAHYIRFDNEDQLLSMGFFDDEFDPIDFLLLSRRDASPEVLLLINDNDQEFNQVIDKIELRDDDLWLWIRSEAIDAVDYHKIHVQIAQPNRQIGKYLQQLFAHSEVVLKL